MTARKMTVNGVEIPASVLDAVDAKMSEHTTRPFTSHSVTEWVGRARLLHPTGPTEDFRVADRIIQRHRKAGRIVQSKRGQWLWVPRTSARSHGEIGDWRGRAYTMAKYMILDMIDGQIYNSGYARETFVVRRNDAIGYMRGHGWLTFTDADLDAATQGEDIRWE